MKEKMIKNERNNEKPNKKRKKKPKKRTKNKETRQKKKTEKPEIQFSIPCDIRFSVFRVLLQFFSIVLNNC